MHGGFGLLNREGIPKPAYFAYKYLHAVGGNEIPLQDSQAFAAIDHDRVATVIWDFQQPEQKVSNRPFYSRIVPAAPAPSLHVTFTNLSSGIYRLEVHRTGFRANDAYSAYIDMDAPRELTASQLDQINSLTRDLTEINRVIKVGKKGSCTFSLPMRSNDIVLLTLEKVTK
jgi:xylan 1,4-beta-xylosidase